MRDWCFTPACLEKFCHDWPTAELVRLEEVGHWVLEDAPNEAQAAITAFLARTANSVAGGVS
jgi:pimeloyl-ACP methyl ester carboxylesterase